MAFVGSRHIGFRGDESTAQTPPVTAGAGEGERCKMFMMVKPTESDTAEHEKSRSASWQQFQGSWDQLQVALKKRGGNLTDDDLLRIEGERTNSRKDSGVTSTVAIATTHRF